MNLPRFTRDALLKPLPESAARRRQGGAAIVVVLVLMLVVAAMAMANLDTLRHLKQEIDLLEARQQKQYAPQPNH